MKPVPLEMTPFNELMPRVSPDSRHLVFVSDASGSYEVYLRPFPGPGPTIQVSTDGGTDPFWKGDGRELYYRTRDGHIMAVSIPPGASFSPGVPKPLFGTTFAAIVSRSLYRPTADGQRFLVLAPVGREALPPTTVVLNWSAAPR